MVVVSCMSSHCQNTKHHHDYLFFSLSMRILSLSWRTGSPFGRIHWNFAGGWASTTFQHIREDHEDHGDDGEDHEDDEDGEDDEEDWGCEEIKVRSASV